MKEKKNNGNLGKYILVSVISIIIGVVGMYAITYFYPSIVVSTIKEVQEKVTVNDKGISDGINNIYEAVVVVESYNKNTLVGTGSGFIYTDDGKIMTNHHVIDGANEVKVILSNKETVSAKIIGSDEYADIAILQIDKKHVTKVATLGKSEEVKLGDTVFTIGSPMGKEYAGTVTRGILSGKDRMIAVSLKNSNTNDWIMNVMQTDAAINPGNSGGPLCNTSGEVIGINSMKIVQSSIEGIGFAIPIEDALEYAETIVKGEEISRAFLGIEMIDASETAYLTREGITLDSSITSGVVVMSTIKDGPSEKAGLKREDVIVKLGVYEVKTVAELRYYLYKHKPGETIELEVYRDKEIKKIKVKLGTNS